MDSLKGHVLQSSSTAGGRVLVRGGGHECGDGDAEHASIPAASPAICQRKEAAGTSPGELDSDKLDLTDGCSSSG